MRYILFLIIVTQLFPSLLSSLEHPSELGEQAQSYTIKGVVRDGTTSEPLIFVNIQVEGTSLGTTTNDAGKFVLTLPKGDYHLRCSYVGYSTDTLSVSLVRNISLTIKLYAMDLLLQDVMVYAHQMDQTVETEVSLLSLQSETITEITSGVPDVLRSIQMLPGVSTDNEFSAKYNVRGGNQDENLVLVNDTKVYEPFHLKEAPNASIGIFNTDLISTMNLMTGGFPARYGDRMSSVLDIQYREGNQDKIQGKASVSVAFLDAMVEGPLGENSTFIVGARKSYLEYMLKLLHYAPSIHPSMYDIQGVVSYALTPRSKLLFKFIYSGDDFTNDPNTTRSGPDFLTFTDSSGTFLNMFSSSDSVEDHDHYTSAMYALQSVNILSSSAILKSEISLYDQHDSEHFWEMNQNYQSWTYGGQTEFYQSGTQNLSENALRIQTWELSSNLDLQIAAQYAIKTGASYQRILYDQDQTDQNIFEEQTNENMYPDTTYHTTITNQLDAISGHIHAQSFKTAGYLENIIQLSDQLIFNIGGRIDYFDFNRDLTVSPRVNVSYKTENGITLRGAWGHYYQSPIYNQLAYSTSSDTNTQSQRAIGYVIGLDYDFFINNQPNHFLKFKVEAYHKDYDHLINAFVTSDGIVYYSRKNDAEGRASGINIFITYSRHGFYGWLSYGLLNAQQRLINDPGDWFPRYTDQRHTLSAVSDIDFGKGWSMNVRFVYGSGYAYTPAVYDTSYNVQNWVQGKQNSAYLPAYRRIDVRFMKDFVFFGASASAYLDVNNLLNWQNIQSYRYTLNSSGTPTREEVKLWPILPTFGISIRF